MQFYEIIIKNSDNYEIDTNIAEFNKIAEISFQIDS